MFNDFKPNYKISVSYIFQTTLEDLMAAFTTWEIWQEILSKKFITKAEAKYKSKPNNKQHIKKPLISVGKEISIEWKKYYTFDIKIESIKRMNNYCEIIHRISNISPMESSAYYGYYKFYYNTCEHTTLVKYEYIFEELFMKTLFEDEFSRDEMKYILQGLDSYLRAKKTVFTQTESIMVNTNITKVQEIIFKQEEIKTFFIGIGSFKDTGNDSRKDKIISKGAMINIVLPSGGECYFTIEDIIIEFKEITIKLIFRNKCEINECEWARILDQDVVIKLIRTIGNKCLVIYENIIGKYIPSVTWYKLKIQKHLALEEIKNKIEGV